MIYKKALSLIVLIALSMTVTSCAPKKLPYVENENYFNPTGNFSLYLASNWEIRKTVPSWLDNSVCVGDPKNLQTYFVNKEMKAVVRLDIDKTFINLQKANTNYYDSTFSRSLIDSFYKTLRENLKEQKKIILKNRFVEDFNYQVHSYDLDDLPSKIIEADLNCNDKQELIRKELTTYVLLCDKDDTCFVSFSLISPISDFDKVQELYIDMMKTFSSWHPID